MIKYLPFVGKRALLAALFLWGMGVAAVPARADVGVSGTAGPGRFIYNDLNADVEVSSAVDAGIYYARYRSDFVPLTELYAGNLSFEWKDWFVSGQWYTSPETDNYGFYGAQANVGYRAESEKLTVGGYVTYGRTLNRLYKVPGRGQLALHQNLLGASVEATFRNSVTVRYLYTHYFYQEDPTAFFAAQFGSPSTLPGIVLSVSGFPSHESRAGISWYPSEHWELSFDFDRLLFQTFDVEQSYTVWGLTWYLNRHWGINGSYNLVTGAFSYYTLGVTWYRHGREIGIDGKPGISYNNIP